MGYHRNQAGVEILRVRIMSTNRDKLRPDGSLDSYADFNPLLKQAQRSLGSQLCKNFGMTGSGRFT